MDLKELKEKMDAFVESLDKKEQYTTTAAKVLLSDFYEWLLEGN